MYRTAKLLAVVFSVLLVGGALGAVLMVGPAAAAAGNDTNDDSLVGLPTNETISVNNDTRALEVVAENTNATLDVIVYGVDDAGNETQVATGTLEASGADATDTYSYSSLDPVNYTSYRVNVDGAGAEHLNIQKVQALAGGGGLFGANSNTLLIGAGVALLAALLIAALVLEVM